MKIKRINRKKNKDEHQFQGKTGAYHSSFQFNGQRNGDSCSFILGKLRVL
jgi:hypothetical protein